MKKIIALLWLLTWYAAYAQILTFDFSGIAGNETSANSNFNDVHLSSSATSRGSGLNASSNADRFNSNQWSTTSAIDLTKYLEFTITPQSNKKFTITSLTLKHQRSSTGPLNFKIRLSNDSYTQDVASFSAVDNTNIQTNDIDLSAVSILQNRTSAITFRIYGYDASGSTGAWGPGEAAGNDISVMGATSTLPINLVSFTGKALKDCVQLQWTTASESNNNYFELFKSRDGKQFYPIGRVAGAGYSVSSKSYYYDDFSSSEPDNYYKIMQVDTDGSEGVSKIIYVPVSKKSIIIHPVSQTEVEFSITSLSESKVVLRVFDINGKKHADMKLSLQKGTNKVIIPLQESGSLYIVSLKSQEGVINEKFIR